MGDIKESIWTKLKRLSIVNLFARIVASIYDFLINKVNFIHWLFIVPAIISIVGYMMQKCWLISLAGLIWNLLWLGLLILSISIYKYIDNINKGAGLFYKAADFVDTMDKINKLKSKNLNDEVKETENINKDGEKLLKIVVLAQKILNKIHENPYTTAGLSIALANLFSVFHINASLGLIENPFNINNISWITWVFAVIAPLFGFLCDKIGFIRTQNKFIHLLATIQFYIVFLILVTGFIGGQQSMASIYLLVRRPWDIVFHDLQFYNESYSYFIYNGMGIYFFIFFYFLTPASIVSVSRADLLRYKNGLPGELKLPKTALYCLQYFSIFVLLISLFVGWNEGWIAAIFDFIGWLISAIIQFIAGIFK